MEHAIWKTPLCVGSYLTSVLQQANLLLDACRADVQRALLDKVELLHSKCPKSWVLHCDTLLASIPLQQDLISTMAQSLSPVSEAIKDLTQMLAIAQKLNKDEMFVSPEVVKSANTARALGIDCTCTSWALFEFHSKVNVEKVYKARTDVIDVIRQTKPPPQM